MVIEAKPQGIFHKSKFYLTSIDEGKVLPDTFDTSQDAVNYARDNSLTDRGYEAITGNMVNRLILTDIVKPDIMTSGEVESADREIRRDVPTAEPRVAQGESLGLREEEQAKGIPKAEAIRGVGGLLPAEGGSGEEVRREPGGERGVGDGGLEPSRPPRDTGVGERLETAEPRDINLELYGSLGFDAGAASRFDANIEALRALKKIESENRQATPEEQAILARYSGFGDSAFEPAFTEYARRDKPSWEARAQALKELTTDEEYEAIEKSRINAFFTTPEIIRAMWRAVRRMGADNLSRPHILEPSAGSGRFFGYQPSDLAAKSQRIAVELDSLTGRLLKHQYPQADVYIMGFEKAPLPKDDIDIAISNVPFGNIPVFDPSFRRERKKFTRSIHNYFFGKTLEQLRPGGILAFITSHNTLDAPATKPVRELLAEQADLIGAIRLPQGVFPDTEVVTDIVFMRKRLPSDTPGDKSWVNTAQITLKQKSSYGGGYSYDVDTDISQYFIDHPEMVLGKHARSGSMYRGGEYTVEAEPTATPFANLLNTAINRLPQNIVVDMPRVERKRYISMPSEQNIREGAYVISDDDGGGIYVKRQGNLVNANLSRSDETRVKGMLGVRDAARTVLDMQLRDDPDNKLEPAQEALRKAYSDYVLEHGPLSSPSNAELMERDPDGPFLKALERKDVLKKAKKDLTETDQKIIRILLGKSPPTAEDIAKLQMPIFTKRVIHGMAEKPVTTEADAMSVVKNETGRLDLGRMAALLGKDEKEVEDSLSKQRLIFKNPIGDWESVEDYLSGDVREKLRVAEAAATVKPEYRANVEALKPVQPADIPPGQIGVKMGAPWIPASDIDDFIKYLLDADRYSWRSEEKNYFVYNPVTGDWRKDDRIDGNYAKMTSEYGTSRMPAPDIIERILNGKLVEVRDKQIGESGQEITVRNAPETIAAQEKAALIQKEFQEWIWNDPARAKRLAEHYNNTYNNYRPQNYDGTHQELPGMSNKWHDQIHPHQKDAIWRIVQDRTALLAHEVGFGKTAVMVGAGMELRRLGLSNKNVYVVPKATHAQFRDQFLDVYPYARVLFPSDDDFTPAKRNEFVSRAVTGDWDAIILADSQFRRIPVKPETEAEFLKEEIATIREAIEDEEAREEDGGGYRYRYRRRSRTHKDLQKALERATVRLRDIMARVGDISDKTMYFEDMGIDQLFIDESDAYKNLRFTTKMGRIKGLPNSDSQRAWDMYAKTRYLQRHGNKGVVFSTGTPVANTIAEMYTQMRYLQEPMLEAKGLKHFDAWARTFGETTESIEQTPTGAYKLTQRFAKFANAPELSGIWQQVADIRVADEVPGVVRQRARMVDENGKTRRTVISVPPDQALLDYMKVLQKRADELRSKDPHEDNMLKISSDARKASLDMRMVDANAPANPNGKVAVAAKKIAQVYRETEKDKGTQLVFLDLGTPKAKEGKDTEIEGEPEETKDEKQLLTNVYAILKSQLIAGGIPEEDIGFIHEAKNDRQKIALFNKVNKGDIRVIIGSTSKLGTGVNVQERAASLHHLDCPWRPRDIEQREGRIIRQGNIAYGPKRDETGKLIDPGKGVKVYTYVTERSFDAFMWQAVEAKSKAIKAIMRRSAPPRAIEDIDSFTMSAAEAKAIASGNPDVLKAVTLKNSVNRLQMLRSSYLDAKLRANEQLQVIPHQIANLKTDIEEIEKDTKLVKDMDKFRIVLKGKPYSERAEGGEALVALTKESKESNPVAAPVIGQYRGFEVKAIDQGPQTGYKLIIHSPETKRDYASTNILYQDLTGDGALRRLDNTIYRISTDLKNAKKQKEEAETNLKTYTAQAAKPFDYQDQLDRMEKELNRIERKLQGEKVEDTPSENYELTEEPLEGEEPSYQWGMKAEEQQINPEAEVKAVESEVEPVEKTLEVKPPESKIEKIVESMAEEAPETEAELRKEPWQMTSSEFHSRYPKLSELSASDQKKPYDMMVEANTDIGVPKSEILSLEQFRQELANERFDLDTGGIFANPHKEMVKQAYLNNLGEIPDRVRAEYSEMISEIEAKRAKAKEARERRRIKEGKISKIAIAKSEPITPEPTKEPWQMTQAEFYNTPEGKPTKQFPINVKHRASVEKALSEGKPVPPEVLKEYPDLYEKIEQLRAKPEAAKEEIPAPTAPPKEQRAMPKMHPKTKIYARVPTDEKWRELEARKIDLPGYEEYDFYIHKMLDGSGWVITEGHTGSKLCRGEATQLDAFNASIDGLKKHSKKEIDEVIKKTIESDGESPAYKKPEETPHEVAEVKPKKPEPELELYRTTTGFEEDNALRDELDKKGYELYAVFEGPGDAKDAADKSIGQDIKFVKHISSKETGEKETWEIYSKQAAPPEKKEKKRPTAGKKITEEFMNEIILYGGLPMRRCDVYRKALKDTGDKKAADMFAFSDSAKVASEGTIPYTVAEFEHIEKEAKKQPKARIERKEKPKQAKITKTKKKAKQPRMTKRELKKIHEERSLSAKRLDEALSHQTTIKYNEPGVRSWLKDKGRADIVGIDTPKSKRKKTQPQVRVRPLPPSLVSMSARVERAKAKVKQPSHTDIKAMVRECMDKGLTKIRNITDTVQAKTNPNMTWEERRNLQAKVRDVVTSIREKRLEAATKAVKREADTDGIDTPKAVKNKTKPRQIVKPLPPEFFIKNPLPTTKLPIKGVAKITPAKGQRRPKANVSQSPSFRRGKQYYTSLGNTTAVSRRPLGRRRKH